MQWDDCAQHAAVTLTVIHKWVIPCQITQKFFFTFLTRPSPILTKLCWNDAFGWPTLNPKLLAKSIQGCWDMTFWTLDLFDKFLGVVGKQITQIIHFWRHFLASRRLGSMTFLSILWPRPWPRVGVTLTRPLTQMKAQGLGYNISKNWKGKIFCSWDICI